MLHENKTDIFAGQITHAKAEPARISGLEAEISQFEEQARSLIRKQRSTPENIQQLYAEELQKIGEQLKHMKETRNRLQGEVLATQQSTIMQQATLGELADLPLEKFWQQDSRYINQLLHRIMGNRRLVILNRELIGVAEVHRKQR